MQTAFPSMQSNLSQLEAQPLIDTPIVAPLQYSNVFKAARTFSEAYANDPVLRYVRNSREPVPGSIQFEKIFLSVLISLWIRRKIALTVKSGVSFIIATPARDASIPADRSDRFADWLTTFLLERVVELVSDEERHRQREVETKIAEAVAKSLGDRVNSMLYVNAIATEPISQGQGYGGALLDTIASLADLTCQAIWLQSSNIKNTGFYNAHGYKTVAEVVIGDQNPTWHENPVIVSIMVREHHGVIPI